MRWLEIEPVDEFLRIVLSPFVEFTLEIGEPKVESVIRGLAAPITENGKGMQHYLSLQWPPNPLNYIQVSLLSVPTEPTL